MGYSRAIHHACAIAAVVGLTGCKEEPKSWSRDEIVDIADDSIDASGLEARVTALQSRVDQLEAKAGKTVPEIRPPGADDAAFLTISGARQGSFKTVAACQEAQRSILEQFDQQCRDSGAAVCGNARVICVPQ